MKGSSPTDIDPSVYEKYSGRSGGPYKRLGEPFFQNVKQQHRRTAAKDMSYCERSLIAHPKTRVVGWVIVAILAVAGVIWRSLS